MCTYWQIAAGDNQRDYSCLFLKYGMAFTGAGLKKVKIGDIMVLKQGITAIIAAGVVVERNGTCKGCVEEWLLDYDGWDLPEYCYVDWKKPNSNKPIKVRGLNIGALNGLHQPQPKGVAKDILSTGTPVSISPLPSSRKLKDDEILKLLIEEGLRPSSSDELTSSISKIRLLADYYYKQCGYGVDIGEHEIRTFLVVPLLLALGWSEQQIKIELACGNRKRVDIAYFRKPCGSKKKEELKKECVAIIETKSFSVGLDYAHEQAKTYSKDFPNCQAVITTNGYCYKVYLRDQCDKFQETPAAYINLLSPRDKYLLVPENVRGALEAIKWLLPNNLILMSYQNTSQRPE